MTASPRHVVQRKPASVVRRNAVARLSIDSVRSGVRLIRDMCLWDGLYRFHFAMDMAFENTPAVWLAIPPGFLPTTHGVDKNRRRDTKTGTGNENVPGRGLSVALAPVTLPTI